ncbi:MAG: CsgG/HfaB family protein [Opitutales bacterium]|nr:CsgG/HfaB family protein [Opitutales bacterium]
MNKTLKLFLSGLTLLLCHSVPVSAEERSPALTTAVLDFSSNLPEKPGLGAEFADLLQVYLSLEDNLRLVERSQLETIMSEQELSLSGTLSPDHAARIGQLSGAQVLVTGRIFSPNEQQVFLVARIIGTETGRVFGEMVQIPAPAEEVNDAAMELAGQIASTIRQRASELVAEVETEEQRLDRLRAYLPAEGDLPTVKVNIPEEHFGQFIPDPAAETEIKRTLQQLGYQLVDEGADWTITGEAFSEFGSRRGNLISCMARVEIRLQPHSRLNREGHLVERQTSSGVALGENVAAKNALQNAGFVLVERIVPLLVVR